LFVYKTSNKFIKYLNHFLNICIIFFIIIEKMIIFLYLKILGNI
jgi:hypothetical protein